MRGGAVLELLDAVWKNANVASKGRSWERLNHSMRDALRLAIGSGFEFGISEWNQLTDGRYRHGYWIGDQEWAYALAIECANRSAILSMEQSWGRAAIIADLVEGRDWRQQYIHTSVHRAQRGRVAVGFSFYYAGERVYATSFRDHEPKDTHVVACAYHEGRVRRLYRLTRADIIADRAARKKQRLAALKGAAA